MSINQSISIKFHPETTQPEIAEYIHKVNVALGELEHGAILKYVPSTRDSKIVILECPFEVFLLAEAIDRLPREIRGRVLELNAFTEVVSSEEAA